MIINAAVHTIIQNYPAAVKDYALQLRTLIIETASANPPIGPLSETLKWNEPAYLTEATKSGSTVRFDWKAKQPGKLGLFLNCKTSLISDFRALFPDTLKYEGNRAVWLDTGADLPHDILAILIKNYIFYFILFANKM